MNKTTRLSKANHYKNFFEENKNGIEQAINIDKKSTQKINCIRDGNLYIRDAKQMAEMFNNNFSHIGQKLEKKH